MTQTPRERWYADETNVPYFAKVLADPKVVEALAVLEDEGRAVHIPERGTSAEMIMAQHALKHKELIGYNNALTKLRELAEKEPLPPQGTPAQYDDEYMKKWAEEKGYALPVNTEPEA